MAQLKDLLVNGSARVIGSLFANLNGNVLNFGVCSTAAATAAKTVTTNGTFELITGSKILVLFSETDTSNAPTLNVNGTGAKSIKINASDGIGKGFLVAQLYYWFIYDGTNWRTAGAGITLIIPTQYGGTGNSSYTANRIIYSNTATKLASGTVTTDGAYLSNISYLSVNRDHQTDYRARINGTTYIDGLLTIAGGMKWPAPLNIQATASANDQEWSIDLNPGSYTGTYFHIWSSTNGASIALFFNDNRHVVIPVHLAVGGYNNTSYGFSANSAIINSWIRTKGNTGWYNEDHGGGWYMTDTTWIKSYNNKRILIDTTAGNDTDILRLTTNNASASGKFLWGVHVLASNMVADSNIINVFGKALSTGNSGYIGYNWHANNDDANFITIGHYGVDHLVRIYKNGAVALGATANGYKLYVNGTSYFNGLTTVYGPLRVGRDDAAANTGYATANVGANNYISFYGVYGDNAGGYNHTYIGESIWGPKGTANEQSELLLFHGNDPRSYSGPDRIRLFAGEVDIQVYTSALSGTWDTIRATTGILIANFKNNMSTFSTSVTVGTSTSGALGIALTDGAGRGISLYNGPVATGIPEYGIAFAKTATFGTHGAVTSDWATYFTMSDTTTRGWIFRRGSTNVASIDGTGKLYLGYAASAANPGIYWNPYVESASDGSDVSAIYQIKSGVAGGTELRISQANDATDVINIVSPQFIYLNSKKAFKINDTWLRINEDKGFSSGIYTGSSLVRTDNQFQVGDSGEKFYANSSGNGYFSNTLGIAGTNTSYKLYVNGTSYFNGNATHNGNVLPNTTNTYDLGSSSLRWRKLYIGTANSYGSNNNNLQPIYWNDGVPSPIGWYFKYCTINSGNKSNYPWHRVATCNLGTGSWVDKDCIIIIRARFNSGFYGMIKISARANNATTNPKGGVNISATWLIRRGINVDNIRICKKGLSGESNLIDFYVRVETYARALGYIVEGSNNGWSLINSNEVNDTTANDKKTSTEVWKDITTSQGATAYDTIVSGVDNTLNGNLAKKLTIQANGVQKGLFNNSADVTVNLGNVALDFTGANSGNANNINADTFAGMTRQQWLNTVYPIGSIYMSVNATSPATLFGGTWESLGGRFLIGQDGTYTAGSTGGEASHTLTLAEAPAHTHGRGTMNITGQWKLTSDISWNSPTDYTGTGAIVGLSERLALYGGHVNTATGVNEGQKTGFLLDASRNWTGETDSKGGGGAHNNMPPYLAVYMWKRTA